MGLLIGNNETPGDRAASIDRRVRLSASNVANTYVYAYNSIWHHPVHTPEDMFAALGTDAVELFGFVAIVQQIYPDKVRAIPAGWTLTPNPDGSITPTYTTPNQPDADPQ